MKEQELPPGSGQKFYSSIIILQPDEEWVPNSSNNLTPFESDMDKSLTPDKCTYHVYKKVTLLTSIVEECSKCGELKEENDE